jgi:hypothetical protein
MDIALIIEPLVDFAICAERECKQKKYNEGIFHFIRYLYD